PHAEGVCVETRLGPRVERAEVGLRIRSLRAGRRIQEVTVSFLVHARDDGLHRAAQSVEPDHRLDGVALAMALGEGAPHLAQVRALLHDADGRCAQRVPGDAEPRAFDVAVAGAPAVDLLTGAAS